MDASLFPLMASIMGSKSSRFVFTWIGSLLINPATCCLGVCFLMLFLFPITFLKMLIFLILPTSILLQLCGSCLYASILVNLANLRPCGDFTKSFLLWLIISMSANFRIMSKEFQLASITLQPYLSVAKSLELTSIMESYIRSFDSMGTSEELYKLS
eukprot:NODE_176_length_15869_cov_0.275777.p8 type:complete len:157 gc:universal NODE_176_length_15869_cov_0.275777:6499-6969(+)